MFLKEMNDVVESHLFQAWSVGWKTQDLAPTLLLNKKGH